MCKREQVYLGLVNAVTASKLKLLLAKLFGETQIIRQDNRVFIVRRLNNKPYLLCERRKA